MIGRFAASVLVPAALLLAGAAFGVPASAGGGCHDRGAETTEAVGTVVVRMDGCTFAPTIDRVPAGTTVTFLNTSNGIHDVTGREWAWQSPKLEPGDSHAMRFGAPGIYPYSCSLHPGMAGVVVVGDGVDPAGLVVDAPSDAPTGATPDGQGAAAVPAPADDGSVPPSAALAVGAVGLLLGAAVTRAFARRRAGS